MQAGPGAAFVFRSGDARNGVLSRSTCRWQSHRQVGRYEVWQPAERCGAPLVPELRLPAARQSRYWAIVSRYQTALCLGVRFCVS
ncbi:hypothetical protein Acsp02_30980 [Actinoplanes sp. NBRC 103695]|nr:hypothetical protein Acsp02_30980 [Actinoplanes sp. NBRC 103695]